MKKKRMIDHLIFLNKVTGYSLSADEMQMCEDGQQEPGMYVSVSLVFLHMKILYADYQSQK